jgi:hypothetical protein
MNPSHPPPLCGIAGHLTSNGQTFNIVETIDRNSRLRGES